MKRAKSHDGIFVTGLRLGESKMRDGKIKRAGCSAGGECGIPDASDSTYSPLLQWKTCNVIDWLNGWIRSNVPMDDIWEITRRLVAIYGVKLGPQGFDWHEQEISATRFGCIGCPAIEESATAPRAVVHQNGEGSPLNELYAVWHRARRPESRIYGTRIHGFGPLKMSARKELFSLVMDIQRRAGVTLITEEDEAFIRQCWADKVYPQGWSEEDEATVPPSDMPLMEKPA